MMQFTPNQQTQDLLQTAIGRVGILEKKARFLTEKLNELHSQAVQELRAIAVEGRLPPRRKPELDGILVDITRLGFYITHDRITIDKNSFGCLEHALSAAREGRDQLLPILRAWHHATAFGAEVQTIQVPEQALTKCLDAEFDFDRVQASMDELERLVKKYVEYSNG